MRCRWLLRFTRAVAGSYFAGRNWLLVLDATQAWRVQTVPAGLPRGVRSSRWLAGAALWVDAVLMEARDNGDDADDRFAAIARELLDQPSPRATAERVVELAVQLVTGCDHAGISLVEHRKISTVAATDKLVIEGDQRQYTLDEGPCLDSIRDEETIRVPHLATDQRWPAWGPWVSNELGVQSMLCLQLFTSDHSYGGINLYSNRPAAFDAHDEAIALALAAHAAVAIATSRTISTLGTALTSRTIIGQAEGILMERFGLSADQAFSVLVRISQSDNRRLILVAEELVKTRNIPGARKEQDLDRP